MDQGTVVEAAAYSDAMDPDFIGLLPEALKGCTCRREALFAAVEAACDPNPLLSQMLSDIKTLIAESF